MDVKNGEGPRLTESKVRERYNQDIVPGQRDLLYGKNEFGEPRLRVKEMKNLIGTRMADKISMAFTSEEKFSDKNTAKAVEFLKKRHQQSSFREIPDELLPYKRWIVQQTRLAEGKLISTEILKVPEDSATNRIKSLEYSNLLYTDTTTGLTGDLIDLLPLNTKAQIRLATSENLVPNAYAPGELPFHGVINIQEGTTGGEKDILRTATIAHEAGHAHQNLTYKDYSARIRFFLGTWNSLIGWVIKRHSKLQLPESGPKIVVEERNAAAFSLHALHRYRELGVDLLQGSTPQVLIDTHYALQRYDQIAYPIGPSFHEFRRRDGNRNSKDQQEK